MAFNARLLTCEVAAVTKGQTALEAAKMMTATKTGCVVVIEGGRVIGLFSERDLLNRVVSPGKDPAKTLLNEVMTPNPVMVELYDPLEKVFSLFAAHRFRHLPVIELGRLVGIVSLSDVAKILDLVSKEPRFIQAFAESITAQRGKKP